MEPRNHFPCASPETNRCENSNPFPMNNEVIPGEMEMYEREGVPRGQLRMIACQCTSQPMGESPAPFGIQSAMCSFDLLGGR